MKLWLFWPKRGNLSLFCCLDLRIWDFWGQKVLDITVGRGRGRLSVRDHLLPYIAYRKRSFGWIWTRLQLQNVNSEVHESLEELVEFCPLWNRGDMFSSKSTHLNRYWGSARVRQLTFDLTNSGNCFGRLPTLAPENWPNIYWSAQGQGLGAAYLNQTSRNDRRQTGSCAFTDLLSQAQQFFHHVREAVESRRSRGKVLNLVFGREREIFNFPHMSLEIGFIIPVEANAFSPNQF